MESINFLTEKLHGIFNLHSYLEIKYEYRRYIQTHIIEVKPVHCFESDKQYIDQQINLEELFEELFPEEEILFITENNLIKVEEPILKLGVSELMVTADLIGNPTFTFSACTVPSAEYEYMQCTTASVLPKASLEQYEEYAFDIIRPKPKYFKEKLSKLSNIIKAQKKGSEIKSESFFFH